MTSFDHENMMTFSTPAFSFTNNNIHFHYSLFATVTHTFFVSQGLTLGGSPDGVDHVFLYYKKTETHHNKWLGKKFPVVLVERVDHANFVVSIQNSDKRYTIEQLETVSTPYILELEKNFGSLNVKPWFEAPHHLPNYLLSNPKMFKRELRKKYAPAPHL